MVAIWCGNFIALKVCLRVLSPVGVTAFRVVAAALLLFFIQRYSPDRYAFDKLGKSDYWLFLKLAFVGLLMNQVLFISGLKFTTVAHSALVRLRCRDPAAHCSRSGCALSHQPAPRVCRRRRPAPDLPAPRATNRRI